MIRLIIAFLLCSTTLYAQETPSTSTVEAPERSQERIYSFSEGTSKDRPVRLESIRTGSSTLTTGTVGQKPVNALTIQLGRTQITTGTIGNESFETITFSPKD